MKRDCYVHFAKKYSFFPDYQIVMSAYFFTSPPLFELTYLCKMKYIDYQNNTKRFRYLASLGLEQFGELLPCFEESHNA
jgi:hypothetical protein